MNTTNTTLSPAACNVTTSKDPYIVNGGFEDDLVNWTAVAYNSSSSTFEIGVTNEALQGCSALLVAHTVYVSHANDASALRCRSQTASHCLTTSKRQPFSPIWNPSRTTRSIYLLGTTALYLDRTLTQIPSIRFACQTIPSTLAPSAALLMLLVHSLVATTLSTRH